MKKLFLALGLAVVFLASCCNNNQQGAQKCDGKAEQKCEQKCDGKHDHQNCEQKCDGKHDHQNCEKKCDGKHEHQNCEQKCEGHNHGEGTCNKEAKKAECNKQDAVKTDAVK